MRYAVHSDSPPAGRAGRPLRSSFRDLAAGGYLLIPANRIAKWDGSNWSGLGTGANSNFTDITASGSDVYVGGYFHDAGGSAANNLAKWNGSGWSAVGPTGLGVSGSSVRAVAVSGTDVYVAGDFSWVGGTSANSIAKWSGTSWSNLGSGLTACDPTNHCSGDVYALAVAGSNVYAGGRFSAAGGVPANNIAVWDGNAWVALGSGIGGDYHVVETIAVFGSGIYVGGSFTIAGGVSANNIARWDGSTWSALGSGVIDSGVLAIAVLGSNVYAGGDFGIAKWNGSAWSGLGSGVAPFCDENYCYGVRAITTDGSRVYVGGGHFNPPAAFRERVA